MRKFLFIICFLLVAGSLQSTDFAPKIFIYKMQPIVSKGDNIARIPSQNVVNKNIVTISIPMRDNSSNDLKKSFYINDNVPRLYASKNPINIIPNFHSNIVVASIKDNGPVLFREKLTEQTASKNYITLPIKSINDNVLSYR